ncbi:MAG: winged helix-turn-helix transcriptional regulator [Firmicutes bacterium]|nr:winged helix-turn-helix transcriptional regulator [Bacillota bacterium]
MLKCLAVLSDSTRFAIIQALLAGKQSCCTHISEHELGGCVSDLVNVTKLSQPTVSHHLKILEQAGLVRKEKRRTWVCYFPEHHNLAAVAHWLSSQLIHK